MKLVSKKGGKSDYTDKFRKDLKAAVIVCSDSIAQGEKQNHQKTVGLDNTLSLQALVPP